MEIYQEKPTKLKKAYLRLDTDGSSGCVLRAVDEKGEVQASLIRFCKDGAHSIGHAGGALRGYDLEGLKFGMNDQLRFTNE